jgi:hypothetical protein
MDHSCCGSWSTFNSIPLLSEIGFEFCASSIPGSGWIDELIIENKIGVLRLLLSKCTQ